MENQSSTRQLSVSTQTTLTKFENELIRLDGCKKVSTFEKDDFNHLAKKLVTISKLLGASEPPEKDVLVGLVQYIKDNHQDMSLDEITKSIDMGVNDGIESYGKLTIVYLSSVIKNYKSKRSEAIFKAKQQQIKAVSESKKQPTQQEIEQSILNGIDGKLKYYIKTGEVIDYGNVLYNYLEKKKVINLSPEEKNRIFQQAKNSILNGLRTEKVKHGNELFQGEIAKKILDVRNGVSPNIVFSSKCIALTEFFDRMISDGKTANDIIELCK